MRTIFINAQLVLPQEIIENGFLAVENNKIIALGAMKDFDEEIAEQIYDLQQAYIIPGFIDIHSDMIENMIQPRSTALMDMEMAIDEAEKQLVQCGITTMFHSVAMYREGSWDAKPIRTAPFVKKLIALTAAKEQREHLLHNRFHLRYELDNLECYELVKELLEKKQVDLISFMDHRPGQGQYKNLSIYRKHLPGAGKDLTDKEFEEIVYQEQNKPMLAKEKLLELAELARKHNIAVASHDDDSVEKIEDNIKLGVSISEFPINIETAKKAKEAGLYPLLGAPNILLGGSHSGNLSAEAAIKEGCGDILCSDYYPQALLRAVFYLSDKGILSLPQACALVSLNPAKAVGMGEETGSLESGKTADFLIVGRDSKNAPLLLESWINGVCAVKNTYR